MTSPSLEPTKDCGTRALTEDVFETTHRPPELAVHEERRRLARELHDTVAQTLYGITLGASRVLTLLERTEPSEAGQVHAIVDEMLHLANEAQTELRTLVQDLRSEASDQVRGGLSEALARQAADLQARAGCCA
jgi:signal transduction histidine kinase